VWWIQTVSLTLNDVYIVDTAFLSPQKSTVYLPVQMGRCFCHLGPGWSLFVAYYVHLLSAWFVLLSLIVIERNQRLQCTVCIHRCWHRRMQHPFRRDTVAGSVNDELRCIIFLGWYWCSEFPLLFYCWLSNRKEVRPVTRWNVFREYNSPRKLIRSPGAQVRPTRQMLAVNSTHGIKQNSLKLVLT